MDLLIFPGCLIYTVAASSYRYSAVWKWAVHAERAFVCNQIGSDWENPDDLPKGRLCSWAGLCSSSVFLLLFRHVLCSICPVHLLVLWSSCHAINGNGTMQSSAVTNLLRAGPSCRVNEWIPAPSLKGELWVLVFAFRNVKPSKHTIILASPTFRWVFFLA